jgi:YHS domain-containing protein
MIIKRLKAIGLAVLVSLGLLSNAVMAKEAPVYTSFFGKVAVSGYDPVAYFAEHKAVQGDAQYSTSYQGAEWRFSTAAHRDAFVADPARYAPQYGGYCAWAVAQGSTASADPMRWRIVNDKLYLNYDADVQKKWEANIPEFIQQANKNWPSVLGK